MPDTKDKEKLPSLAILAGGIGFLLSAALIGYIGWEAVRSAEAKVPMVVVEAGEVHRVASGFVVEFEARNTTAHSAAAVEVEATLEVPGAEPVTSGVTLDYVPGHSTQKGGIFLPRDPRTGRLEIRALGYARP